MRTAIVLGLVMCLGGAAEARRPHRPKRARPATLVQKPRDDAAAEYARGEAQIAELKQMREVPTPAPTSELDFPGQQLDDAERPPATPRRR